MTVVAYIGPEIPALSATFVYEELLALERRGLSVAVFTVRKPVHPALGQEELSARTHVIYDRRPLSLIWLGLSALPSVRARVARAFGWLVMDIFRAGLHRAATWKLAYQWLVSATLVRHLERAGCTHIHVHFAHTPTQLAMYASALTGIPFTVTAHANDIFERGLLLPTKARRAVRMLTISEFNRTYLHSVGVPAHKLAVVRSGSSIPARSDVPACRKHGPLKVGTLGRLVEKKGFDDLILAIGQLRDAGRLVELSVVGEGPLRESLRDLVSAQGLFGDVTFVGALEHDQVVRWLRSLDIFVLACKQDANGDMDGIPVALIEAMTQYVPVISTRLSGIPELVIHLETGLLALPADSSSLALQLERLIDDAGLRAQLAKAGAEHARREFDQQGNLDRLIDNFALGAQATSGRLA